MGESIGKKAAWCTPESNHIFISDLNLIVLLNIGFRWNTLDAITLWILIQKKKQLNSFPFAPQNDDCINQTNTHVKRTLNDSLKNGKIEITLKHSQKKILLKMKMISDVNWTSARFQLKISFDFVCEVNSVLMENAQIYIDCSFLFPPNFNKFSAPFRCVRHH